MAAYDCEFHDKYINESFYYAGMPGEIFFTGEQVNYICVGMGFRHYHLLSPFGVKGSAYNNLHRHNFVFLWNALANCDIATFGEYDFCDYGAILYDDIKQIYENEEAVKRKHKKNCNPKKYSESSSSSSNCGACSYSYAELKNAGL
ncbi:MAG: hypothetical protein JEZ07_17720 [Phycisphaerae bacterium]|nr:hypothetical protein [Phycisphaerae bacterium]